MAKSFSSFFRVLPSIPQFPWLPSFRAKDPEFVYKHNFKPLCLPLREQIQACKLFHFFVAPEEHSPSTREKRGENLRMADARQIECPIEGEREGII